MGEGALNGARGSSYFALHRRHAIQQCYPGYPILAGMGTYVGCNRLALVFHIAC